MNGIEKLKKIIKVQISNINNTINKYFVFLWEEG